MHIEAVGTTLGGDTEDVNWVVGAHENAEEGRKPEMSSELG